MQETLHRRVCYLWLGQIAEFGLNSALDLMHTINKMRHHVDD